MKLNLASIKEKELWQAQGFALPQYDIEAVRRATRETPEWVHIGAGNIFRMFIARLHDELLDKGLETTGVIIMETFNVDKIDVIFSRYDDLSTAVTLKRDGSVDLRVVGCIAETVKAVPDHPDWKRAEEIFAQPSLKVVSLTITEKGYGITDRNGGFTDKVKAEMADPEMKSANVMGTVCRLLYSRFRAGGKPITMVSMDNVSHNGSLFRKAVLAYGKAWTEAGFAPKEFMDYLEDEDRVSFTWSMIDKITPAAGDEVGKLLLERGYEDIDCPMLDGRKRAPSYANAEETEYLVIEDRFVNGRPAWDKGGVIFTDRDTVDRVETMKVTTCLNPLHTALAVYGCLLGFTKINREMQDEDLVNLIKGVGYTEGLPVVTDPGILDPREFIDTVINDRFPNPFVPDMPQRIATDTSQKISVRFGVTLRSYHDKKPEELKDLVYIPAVLAGWARYLLGTDDKGEPMELSSDPMLAELQELLKPLREGDLSRTDELLTRLLRNEKIFGLDLVEAGLSGRIIADFKRMCEGPGSVRALLKELPRFKG